MSVKYTITYFLCFLLFVNCSLAERKDLVPFDNQKGLWGYIDYTSHKEVIPPKYDLAYPFINNYAIVGFEENQQFRFGVIDTLDNYILKPEYKFIYIENGYIHAKKDNQACLFNTDMKEIIPCIYEDIHSTNSRYFFIQKNGKWGCYDIQEQREIIPFDYDKFSIYNNIARISNDSSSITLDQLIGLKVLNHDNIRVIDHEDKRISVIDKSGKIIFSERYGWAGSPSYKEGLMAFIKRDGNGKWGFIDTNGKQVIPYMYDYVDTFGFIGGSTVVSEKGENPTKNKNAVINKSNKLILPFTQDSTYTILEDSTILIFNKQIQKSKLVDNKLNEIIPYRYELIEYIGDGFYRGKTDGLYVVIDQSGKERLSAQFTDISEFKNGMCLVRGTTGKEGFINSQAELIIPCKYEIEYNSGNLFGSGFVYTKDDSLASQSKTMLLDKNGREYIVKMLPVRILK